MTSAELLADAFGRVREDVHGAVADLSEDELAERLEPGANSIAWLVWHLTRVMDDHAADAFGAKQVWPVWADRFGLPFNVEETGYGHDSATVAQVRAPAELLLGYHNAVQDMTAPLIATVKDEGLDRIVDRRWTPPVTLGVRLISVLNDAAQHAGQAAFIRGALLRRRLYPVVVRREVWPGLSGSEPVTPRSVIMLKWFSSTQECARKPFQHDPFAGKAAAACR